MHPAKYVMEIYVFACKMSKTKGFLWMETPPLKKAVDAVSDTVKWNGKKIVDGEEQVKIRH
jgi:hypothetical protein